MHVSVVEAVQLLKNGKLVVFPTETVYGLGASALSPEAVEAVYRAKGRPRDNPLICHFYDVDEIRRYGVTLTPLALVLFKAAAPGPLSLLLDLPLPSPLAAATGGRATIICRIPDHPVALELLRLVDEPIAAPSANTSGRMSGTRLDMIEADLHDKIDGYLDGGTSVVGIESTIVDARDPHCVTILRPGVIGREELLLIVRRAFERGEIDCLPEVVEGAHGAPVTPGARYAHYAPNTALTEYRPSSLLEMPRADAYLATAEWLRAQGIDAQVMPVHVGSSWYLSLGSRDDLSSVARRLYYVLYQLDQLGVSSACFVHEDWGMSSLARALEDRIEKMLRGRSVNPR